MKKYFKIILSVVSAFLLMSCGVSEKYSFQEENIYFKLKIKEKYEVDKIIYDDNKAYHYDVIFNGKVLSIYLHKKSIKDIYKECNIVFLKDKNLYIVECGKKENGANYLKDFFVERKIKDNYIVFRPYNENSEEIEFLLQKIKEIEIIEK
jgi:hypothetical protein